MGYWNYRLCQYTVRGTVLFGIREVHYNDDDTMKGVTRASIDDWETADDVRGTLKMMRSAVKQPILILGEWE
jgi:hypothetical protein